VADRSEAALAQVAAAAPGTPLEVPIDVQMPGMDGLEATRRLCALAPVLSVLGLTAHVLDDDRLRAEQAGMRAQLGKPLLLEALHAR
jgi:CheY-like chemotaxis protein